MQEKRRIFGPEPESMEIQLLRHQAASEASDLVQGAFLQAEEIREESRKRGFDEGRAAGYEVGREEAARTQAVEMESMRATIQDFVDLIDAERRQLWLDAEPQIIAFVLEIAGKVVKDEARVNRDVALSVVRNALRRVVDTGNIRIRVHMEDLDTIRSSRDELATLLESIRDVEIVADRRVDPGGCVVETGSGTIDAKLDTQLDEVAAALQFLTDEAA
jgi:flagellar assembly protein FliH